MVRAYYCASYSKQPCIGHEVNMWCPCCYDVICSRPFDLIELDF